MRLATYGPCDLSQLRQRREARTDGQSVSGGCRASGEAPGKIGSGETFHF